LSCFFKDKNIFVSTNILRQRKFPYHQVTLCFRKCGAKETPTIAETSTEAAKLYGMYLCHTDILNAYSSGQDAET